MSQWDRAIIERPILQSKRGEKIPDVICPTSSPSRVVNGNGLLQGGALPPPNRTPLSRWVGPMLAIRCSAVLPM